MAGGVSKRTIKYTMSSAFGAVVPTLSQDIHDSADWSRRAVH